MKKSEKVKQSGFVAKIENGKILIDWCCFVADEWCIIEAPREVRERLEIGDLVLMTAEKEPRQVVNTITGYYHEWGCDEIKKVSLDSEIKRYEKNNATDCGWYKRLKDTKKDGFDHYVPFEVKRDYIPFELERK